MEDEKIFEFSTMSDKLGKLTLDDEIYLEGEFLGRIENKSYTSPKQEVETILSLYGEELFQIFDYSQHNFKL